MAISGCPASTCIEPLHRHAMARLEFSAIAFAFATQVLGQSRRQLGLSLPHCLVAEDEPAGQEHFLPGPAG